MEKEGRAHFVVLRTFCTSRMGAAAVTSDPETSVMAKTWMLTVPVSCELAV